MTGDYLLVGIEQWHRLCGAEDSKQGSAADIFAKALSQDVLTCLYQHLDVGKAADLCARMVTLPRDWYGVGIRSM